MNFEDVMKLVEAGFTADEIRAAASNTFGLDPAPSVTAPPVTADPAPPVTADPAPSVTADPAPSVTADIEPSGEIAGLRKDLHEFIQIMRAGAVRGFNAGSPDVETTPDILAKVINPYTKEEVK